MTQSVILVLRLSDAVSFKCVRSMARICSGV